MTKRQKIVLLAVFLAGLLLLFTPTILNWYNDMRYRTMIEEWERSQRGADYSEMWAEAESYNAYLAEKPNQFAVSEQEEEYLWTLLNPLETGMMGYIDIPDINIHIPIYQGTDDKYLQSGSGMMIGTSLPTGGPSTHCVITAHNGMAKAKMFTDLGQLELGDQFELTILDRAMTYEVSSIETILPEEFEPLKIQPGEDLVTLYTCTPYGVNSHRLLVTGSRVPE